MKRNLLILMLCFFAFTGYSQQAYQAPDLTQCNNEVFNLTAQVPTILGNQNPENFSVMFHTTLADAQAGVNAIPNPAAYVLATWPRQTIFARVSDTTSGQFATTSFDIIIGTTNLNLQNVTACGSYTLPSLTTGVNYYTQPAGQGTMIAAGTTITQTTVVYVFAQNNPCSVESSFTVTILPPEAITEEPLTLMACEIPGLEGTAYFDLGNMSEQIANNFTMMPLFNYFTTLADAQNNVNPITNIHAFQNVVTYNQTIYVRVETLCGTHVIPVVLQVIDCTAEADITGVVRLDENGDGCNVSDAPVSGIVVGYNIGNYVQYTYTDVNGNYSFYGVTEGTGNIWVQNINGQNFLATPTSLPITYSGTLLQNDFCLTAPAPVNDVVAVLSPYNLPVPGFQTSYYVGAFNAGNISSTSGTLTLTFNPALVSLSNAGGGVANGNTITWSYTNLQPQSGTGFTVSFTVAPPPTVISGTQIPFSLTVANSGTDVNPANNTYVLNQTAVNSYDPNDITVKEGEYITIAQADDYLHYTIRFQNNGTANAQKLRIALPLDVNVNSNTFQPLISSHLYRANRTTDAVEFIFDNIDLPYESANEPGSHGFVTFRIKPAFGIEVGDSMNETASIYFDFNEAIVTNTATTTVTTVSATDVVNAKTFSLLPNPANGKVRVITSEGLNANAAITITDMLGKKLISQSLFADGYVNISSLSTGIYMVSLANGATITTQKLIVK